MEILLIGTGYIDALE